MSGSNNSTRPEEIVTIGLEQAIMGLKAYLAEMHQKNMEMELKAAKDDNLATIEKTEEVIMWEKKLQDKKALVETLQSQLDSREDHLNQAMLSNDIKLDLLRKELESKDKELATLKEFIGKLPAGNA